jgi:large subunit ribosomal protein L31
MKPIHPQYESVTILCTGCNTAYETRSTSLKGYHVEICSACHPFFTGKMKFVDATGRVEKFQKKYQRSSYGQKGKATETPGDAEKK